MKKILVMLFLFLIPFSYLLADDPEESGPEHFYAAVTKDRNYLYFIYTLPKEMIAGEEYYWSYGEKGQSCKLLFNVKENEEIFSEEGLKLNHIIADFKVFNLEMYKVLCSLEVTYIYEKYDRNGNKNSIIQESYFELEENSSTLDPTVEPQYIMVDDQNGYVFFRNAYPNIDEK